MSGSPPPEPDPRFVPDADAAARISERAASIGAALTAAVLDAAPPDHPALVPADSVRALVGAFGLRSARDVAVLAVPAAASLARPRISAYRVGAAGLATTGDLILGGNLEFPGASMHHTVHAEGFVTLRARALRLALESLAVSRARPCAHCRQVLAEMAWADTLRVMDPMGHDVALGALYPWPFTPADLGMLPAGVTAGDAATADGASPGPRGAHTLDERGIPHGIAQALARAGARAHAPYSGEPAAIVLRAADGRLCTGAVLESVAFNPTIGPLQDALVEAVATAVPLDAIVDAWLATVDDGRVDHAGPVRDLLAAVAPEASLHVTYWS